MKHGSNTLENYIRVHEKVLRDYSQYIITQNPMYSEEFITANWLALELDRLEVESIKGNRIFIKISKDVEVSPGVRKPLAKLSEYSYHAWYKSSGNNILRYCSPHPDHNKFHHRHDYTVIPLRTTQVGKDEWPHVSEFLEELIFNH